MVLALATVWGFRLALYLTWRKNREGWVEDADSRATPSTPSPSSGFAAAARAPLRPAAASLG